MSIIFDIGDLFEAGMKRTLPALEVPHHDSRVLNLGAGNTSLHLPGRHVYNLDLPEWDATRDWLHAFASGTIGGIYAFHFFEHLTGEDSIKMLRECLRVLEPGAPLTIVVPHHMGTMAFHDLTHKSFYNIDTWSNLLNNRWQVHERDGWTFDIGLNIVIGVAERNLALMTQLIKTEE